MRIHEQFGYLFENVGKILKPHVGRSLPLPSGRFVTLSFDGIPKCTRDYILPKLEQRNWLVNWFNDPISEGGPKTPANCTMEELQSLSQCGHEIGNHIPATMTPNDLDSALEAFEEIITSHKRYLGQDHQPGLSTGVEITGRNLNRLQRSVKFLRTPITASMHLEYQPKYLNSIGINTQNGGINAAVHALMECRLKGGWLIVNVHDIAKNHGKNGCTPQAYDALIQAIEASGALVITIEDMVDWSTTLVELEAEQKQQVQAKAA